MLNFSEIDNQIRISLEQLEEELNESIKSTNFCDFPVTSFPDISIQNLTKKYNFFKMSKLKLVENLENQLFRLVDQVKDLKDCKEELSSGEFSLIKEEIVDESQQFSQNLNRLHISDMGLRSKFFDLKLALRKAIGDMFNNYEMQKIFGAHDEILLQQVIKLEEELNMKLIDQSSFVNKKSMLLEKMKEQEAEEKLSIESSLTITPEEGDSVSDIFTHSSQNSGSDGL